jgi:hypothetical protein
MDDDEPISLLTRPLSPSFARRVLVVAPGRAHAYDAADWHDALVVVEGGEIELEGRDGGRECFASGAVLWLTGLPLRALWNRGREPAVLVAVSRRLTRAPGTAGRSAARTRPRSPSRA